MDSHTPHEAPLDFNDPIWAILRSLPTLLSYWDADLQCRFANHAHEGAFGLKPSQLFDSSLRDFLGAEHFARREPEIRAVLRGEPQEFERTLPDADGKLRPGLVNLLPHVVNGKVIGFIGQVTDVSRLHGIQVALAQQVSAMQSTLAVLSQSEANLRQAESLGRIGSWSMDVASGAVKWSPQLYVITGVDASDPAPHLRDHSTMFTPDSWQQLQQRVDRAVNQGEPYTLEVEHIRRDGQHDWLELRGAAVRNAEGKIITLHGTAQDVSERRLAGDVTAGARRVVELEAQLAAAEARVDALEHAIARRIADGNGG
ncbi:MAG: PAS domain-containing protein [Pseudomonadota bacterium]